MNEIVKQPENIKSLMNNDIVKAKFAEILGKNANAYISSVTTLATTTALKDCEPKSILSCAITAASLNLQINPSLGFAAIIPYKSKNGLVAQFQIQWKGLWQLAIRSGQFERINVSAICEGEFKGLNKLTGEVDITGEKISDKIVGYISYFRLINGLTSQLYMSIEDINKHAKKFSKTYDNQYGAWKTNYEAMCSKTVLKLLLSRYAPLSVEMQTAIQADQSIIKTDDSLNLDTFIYIDNEPISEIDENVKAERKEQNLTLNDLK